MKPRFPGFTLLEVLTVVAVIGVLVALLLPSLAAARAAANRASTKVRFNEWAEAIESFRAEYGFYPQFPAGGLVNDGAGAAAADDHPFHDVLAGRRRDGHDLPEGGSASSAAVQNPRRIRFHTFGAAEFDDSGRLQDAFGNPEIAVLVDADLDGVIKVGADVATLPAVHAADGAALTPSAADFPPSGLRAGVVFYSADPRASAANPRLILSWK